MDGCSLKQILHLQGEVKWYLTSTDIYLLFTRDQMKDRCIDDVAIHHSFVSRNYRKDLSSCATIFCFSKFDIAHDLVQALVSDTAEKWVRMLRFSSRLSVQGYDSSSANKSSRGFFRRDNKLFFSTGCQLRRRWQEALTR